MAESPEHLRILIANERADRLYATTDIVAGLGHEVISRSLDVEEVTAATEEVKPDVALVGLASNAETTLDVISRIVQGAKCPVIAVLAVDDREFVNEAARRGIFAYVTAHSAEELQSSLDIVLRRFREFRDLEGAFGRRAVTERAKGILMERHSVDEASAFEMLREHSRTANRKLVDVATAVVDGHRLLPKQPQAPS
jgi:AmiR/NasT family two-component response regulator